MYLRPGLEMKAIQRTTLSPRLRQSLAMLRMPALELQDFLAAEVEANPLLTLAETAPEARPPARPARAAPPVGEDAAARVPARVTLAEHVVAQVRLFRLDPSARRAAEELAHALDEEGYLRDGLKEALARHGLHPVARALAAIRACEPTGLGAFDLADCLALQLAERGRLDPPMRALLQNLPLLPQLDAAMMARRCGVSLERLSALLAELRSLDPRPGLTVAPSEPPSVTPDLRLSRGPGGWRLELTADAVPALALERRPRVGGAKEDGAGAYLAERTSHARWLMRALDRRGRTLLRVAEALVAAQTGFLFGTERTPRPFSLAEAAAAAATHPSTASRAIGGKHLETPRGVLPLAILLARSGEGGGLASTDEVLERIRRLIMEEPLDRPLTDARIARLLQEEGVALARRTIAKHRETLNIPPACARRRRAASALGLDVDLTPRRF